MSSLNLYISESEKAELKRISAVTGKSASDLVREMITDLSAKHPEHKQHTVYMCWELRDTAYGKIKTKAWVSRDQTCYILRNPYNQRFNLPSPCDTDVIQEIANNRYKIKILGEMIYDTCVATKHINVCDGGYELDGITWDKLPSTEYEFYIEGCAE